MLLQIKNLRVRYGNIEVVRGVDLSVAKGECSSLVGESGCGKTTVGLSITRLIPEQKGRIASGNIFFQNKDITRLGQEGLEAIRGKRISYVFQEAFSSLNPVFTVYEQMREILSHMTRPDDFIEEIFCSVGLSEIAGKKNIYPHELSGGMQQRVMLALAVALKPDLLILDEPTTALDATVQKKILMLLEGLREKLGLAMLFISHDLRIIFSFSDRINVMYAGVIVESAYKKNLLLRPRHPYTKALIDSVPCIEHRKTKFSAIGGRSPLFSELPKGCKFCPRCFFRINECAEREPDLVEVREGHLVRCIRAKELDLNGVIKDK